MYSCRSPFQHVCIFQIINIHVGTFSNDKICPWFPLQYTRGTSPSNPFLVCTATLGLLTFAPQKDFSNCELFPPMQLQLMYKHPLAYWLSKRPFPSISKAPGCNPTHSVPYIRPAWKTVSSFLIFGQRLTASSFHTLAMPVDFSGTWNLVSNDNFEGYMVALGRCKYLVLSFL